MIPTALRPLLAAITGLTFLIATGIAAKPGGGGSTLPKVRYQIQMWDMPHDAGGVVNDMNNLGQVVGWELLESGAKHAYLYDPQVDPTTAVDLNAVVAAPEDWVIASAVAISDSGVIVGYLEPVESDGTVRAGYVLDTAAEAPALQPLPDGEWAFTYPRGINEDGDILGVYRKPTGLFGVYVYNPAVDTGLIDLGVDLQHENYCALNNSTPTRGAQVALQVYDGSSSGFATSWTRADGFTAPLPGSDTSVRDINDAGTLCGGTYAKPDNKGPTRLYPFRYSTALEVLAYANRAAGRINSAADLLLGEVLYRQETGFLRIDDLIDRNDPDSALWFTGHPTYPSDMTDRVAGPDLGLLAGRHELTDGTLVNFLLIPVSIP